MTPDEFTNYLHQRIPLTAAMAVAVVSLTDDSVTLSAPLAPNINHSDTVFGGSAASLATLACWSLITLRLQSAGVDGRAVVRRAEMDYILPIDDNFRASCHLTDKAEWGRLLRALERRGRGKISLGSELVCRNRPVATFSGDFAVLVPEPR